MARVDNISNNMEISSIVLSLLATYQLPTIFVTAFFGGEGVIMTSAFLAARGIWSIEAVFFLTLTGTVAADIVWFLFGYQILQMFGKYSKLKNYTGFEKKLNNIFGKRPFLILLFIKFLYGTRILTIVYLSYRKMSLKMFALYDTIGTMLWLAVILPIGWFAGKGVALIIPIFKKTQYALFILVLFIAVLSIVTKWITRKISKE